MSNNPVSFDAVPESMTDAVIHRRILAAAINRQGQGKLNVTLEVSLNAAASTTTITDARIGMSSALLIAPKTANAAQRLTQIWVSSTQSGQATLSHPNNLGAGCVVKLVILG